MLTSHRHEGALVNYDLASHVAGIGVSLTNTSYKRHAEPTLPKRNKQTWPHVRNQFHRTLTALPRQSEFNPKSSPGL